MDWELYDRQRATWVFVGVALFSFLLLLFRHTSTVTHLQSALMVCTLPSQRAVSWLGLPTNVRLASEGKGPVSADVLLALPIEQTEQSRRFQFLQDENARLQRLLDLKKNRWPTAVAARVIGRDPQRWFQEIVINKGQQEGLRLDQPVIALSGEREALIGRIVEVGPQVAKVMLIYDSLSDVAAVVQGQTQMDGVVEGTNSPDLLLKYLGRDSQIKMGDLVVTSGLGGQFPEDIMLGWVKEMSLDARQLFLQARLRPAMEARQLGVVFVLVSGDRE